MLSKEQLVKVGGVILKITLKDLIINKNCEFWIFVAKKIKDKITQVITNHLRVKNCLKTIFCRCDLFV